MSTEIVSKPAATQEEVREQLRRATEPHLTSRQATGKEKNHTDGEYLHKHFRIKPFHKYIAREGRHGNSIAKYPGAFLDSIIYTDERDMELIEKLADSGLVDYNFREPHPSHPSLERYEPMRAKMIEWIAHDPKRVLGFRSVRGTDIWLHGEPGGGKSSLALSICAWRQELNNETIIWSETVDESGTNERTEWLPMAPFATIAVPADLGAIVRVAPIDPSIEPFELELSDIARDVIEYDSINDLMEQLQPGQFYVVYPDPLHRGCRSVSNFDYFNFEQVTPRGEEGPSSPTPADQWWFAFIAHRVSGDVFSWPTFLNIDEAGNLIDKDAEKGHHQHYQKIRWFRDKYADARKKGLSFGYESHSLGEVSTMAREKIRWRVTMNGNTPPIGRTDLPGGRSCPIETNLTGSMPPGWAVAWKDPNFAKIRWPNIKIQTPVDAQVSVDFTRWQEATGAI